MDVQLGDHLKLEVQDGLAVLTLNDPATLNAISYDLVEDILRALNAISRPDSGVRCVLITGEGRAFSSGLNLRRPTTPKNLPVPTIDTHFNPLIRRFRTIPVPVVSAVNGPCVGIGATMAIVADTVVAARSAYFYFPFVWQLGTVGDAGISWILPRLVGWSRARRMLLRSERISAEMAQEWGLVDEVWDDAVFRDKAIEYGRQLAAGPTLALGLVRNMLWSALENSFEDQLRWEVDNAVPLVSSGDAREALQAFAVRRKPEFKGR